MEKKITVLLAPSLELAKEVIEKEAPVATVEAEYGYDCIEGSLYTLAHHGSRSHNPAPCNTEITPLSEGTILVSHIDLDTVGGVLALMNKKPENKEFWEAAEYIDVNGPHHIYELDIQIQNQMNAISAWQALKHHDKTIDVKDVTEEINEYLEILVPVLDEKHPEHKHWIEQGKIWSKNIQKEIESKLIAETENVRVFKTDGIFCNASYYSPKLQRICPSTIAINTKFDSITIAFEDGGKKFSAREIAQSLWGPEAGGHNGIAGSPRGWKLTETELMYELARASAKLDMAFENIKTEDKINYNLNNHQINNILKKKKSIDEYERE